MLQKLRDAVKPTKVWNPKSKDYSTAAGYQVVSKLCSEIGRDEVFSA